MKHEWTQCWSADHPTFAGHFPGMPIVPGVLLLDAALRGTTERVRRGRDGARQPEAVGEIGSVKFLRPVAPGEILTFSSDVDAAGAGRFNVSSGDQRVAAGHFLLLPGGEQDNEAATA